MFERGSNFDYVIILLVDKASEDPNTSINGVLMAGRWWPNIECWLGSFVVLQRFRTSITKKHYIVVIFSGGGGGRGSNPLSPLCIRT